jgi:deltex-like protein
VVWNGIHHRTALNGGSTNYGYPDPTYFNRVREELAAKSVVLED